MQKSLLEPFSVSLNSFSVKCNEMRWMAGTSKSLSFVWTHRPVKVWDHAVLSIVYSILKVSESSMFILKFSGHSNTKMSHQAQRSVFQFVTHLSFSILAKKSIIKVLFLAWFRGVPRFFHLLETPETVTKCLQTPVEVLAMAMAGRKIMRNHAL